MSKSLCLLAVIAGCLLAVNPAVAAEANRGNLVDVKWLEQHRHGPGVLILDASLPPAYAAKHIPGALNVDAMAYGGREKPREETERLFQSWAVSYGTRIVMHDQGGSFMATRLLYSLLYHGVPAKDLLILDGGLSKREAAGLPVTKDATPAPKKGPGDLTIEPTRYPVNLRPGVVLSDAAATRGLYPKVFIASGKDLPSRVPDGTVVHVPYSDLLGADGTPSAAKDVWNILAKAGVPRYAELVCVSDDPGEAALTYVILKLMGYPDIKVLVNEKILP